MGIENDYINIKHEIIFDHYLYNEILVESIMCCDEC